MIEQEFSKYVLSSFDIYYTHIAKAKEEHATNPDFPKLFKAAIGAAEDILISMARFVGHRHGMGNFELLKTETDVGAEIASRQLTGWVEVFCQDLQFFWKKVAWVRADFYALNIHVERVLWGSGI